MPAPRAPRRPPTEAKLVKLIAELQATGGLVNPSAAQSEAYSAASAAIRKIYKNGLPAGVDPAVITSTIATVLPTAYDLHYMTRKAGTEHDAAIVQGIHAYTTHRGFEFALSPALVATLAEHGGVAIAAANQALLDAGKTVQRDVHSNLPSLRDRASLLRVSAAMAPWFAPGVVQATLALAQQALPPTRWTSGGRQGATPPQTEDEWALFIACAFHQSAEAQAVIASRTGLFDLLDETALAAVNDVLRAANSATSGP